MKKLVTVCGLLILGLAVLISSVILGVNAAGGLPPAREHLTRLPLVGPLLKVRSSETEEPAAEPQLEEQQPEDTGLPFAELADRGKMEPLIRELEREKRECAALKKNLERRLREVKARGEQLAADRKELVKDYRKKQAELQKLRDQISARKKALEQTRVIIQSNEQQNLKDTAKIYERMDAEDAGEILSEMYSNKPDTVVKLISLMRDRSAGEILATFSDPAACAEITEKLSHVEHPTGKEG